MVKFTSPTQETRPQCSTFLYSRSLCADHSSDSYQIWL